MPIPDLQGQAIQFRVAMDQPIAKPTRENLDLQRLLIAEEYMEFRLATNGFTDSEALKELADLVYVCFQYAVTAGWELDEALDRVHKSNLSKLVDGKPLKNKEGKVLKGPNYNPPYLEDLI